MAATQKGARALIRSRRPVLQRDQPCREGQNEKTNFSCPLAPSPRLTSTCTRPALGITCHGGGTSRAERDTGRSGRPNSCADTGDRGPGRAQEGPSCL